LINVEVTVSERKLRCVTADGHAEHGVHGSDIVCAAVTTLLRTTASLLDERRDVLIMGEARSPGSMNLTVEKVEPYLSEWMEGVTDFFLYGLRMIEREYPERIRLILKHV
jgi:hypothetical protein